jgi:glycerophosphoryl diester phosphodiesterase
MNLKRQGDAETRRRGDARTKRTANAASSFLFAASPRLPLPASPSLRVPLIIGHRGAAAVAPENTLVSFERALKDGADGIEFDVRLAQDGVPVVIHDATLSRTAMRKGRVANLSSSELSDVDAGTWFNLRHPTLARARYARATIPTLAHVFEALKEADALVYVEMKCGPKDRAALAAEVAKMVRAYSLAHRVVVESFDLAAIAEIKLLDSGLRTAALFDRKLSRPAPSTRRMIERAILSGASTIALHRSLATRRAVQIAEQHGLETVVWTADSPAWVKRAVNSGIRAIITNNPAQMFARRARLLNE